MSSSGNKKVFIHRLIIGETNINESLYKNKQKLKAITSVGFINTVERNKVISYFTLTKDALVVTTKAIRSRMKLNFSIY